jgi:hypothetical protein
MLRPFCKKIIFLLLVFNYSNILAGENWPKEIPLPEGGKIIIYQPQPEKLLGPNLNSRAAIAVQKTKKDDPIFGVIWGEGVLETDRDSRMATLKSIKITDVKFPEVQDSSKIDALKKLIETEILKWDMEISLDELAATLEENNQATDDKLSTKPPKIIYMKKPASLVIIDGEPIVKKDDKMNMERVLNSPFLIVKSPENNKFYLYGDKTWYFSSSAKEGFKTTKDLPKSIKSLDESIRKQITENKDTAKAPNPAPEIVISTTPAELISSNGEPDFSSVPGTGLLYMSNTSNNVFMDVASQKYYVLLTGRWYTASAMTGPWTFVEADKLPADFAKIPEGSDKDEVLASVAGTDAAKDAVMDAQIPQTAKVDRKNAKVTVNYDGEPKFSKIEGTSMELAENSSVTVLKSAGKYYAVENGVWFISDNAKGPWSVSDKRPEDVDKIPAESPAYNVKYVYIYESTPEVVYVGYTPGYTGCYVYGPTVVYGTGYYYQPWYGAYYYPAPVTYGLSMHYNPYSGWSMGFHVNYGMFHMSFYGGGGWYGCGGYHPPYGYHRHGGYYGPHGGYGNRSTVIVNNGNINNGNIYGGRDGVSSRPSNGGNYSGNRPSQQPAGGTGDRNRPSQQPGGAGAGSANRPSTQPAGGAGGADRPSTQPAGGAGGKGPSQQPAGDNRAKPSAGTSNNVYSDKQGNVYQNNNGNWQQRDNSGWKDTQPSNQMQRDSQNRTRSNNNTQNYQRSAPQQRSSSPSRSAPSRGGGGGRRR